MLGIGIGIIGLMSGIISLFLMAPHAEHVRPRSLRLIVKLFHSSILLFLIGVLLSITFFVLYIREAKLILPIQSFAYIALYIDLFGWLLLSLGVTAFYREWIEKSVELSLKLRETETEIETKAGTGLDIPKPEEIPPFVIDELRKDIKTINQRLEDLKIPAGAIKEVKPRKEIPETLKHEIELIQAKIELTRDFYGLEKTVWYFMKFGNFYLESKDYEKAIEQYEEVLEKEPENADALFNRGFAYVKKGDYDKAMEDYDLYLEKIDPYDDDAYINRGNAYYGLNQYERAIEDYNKAIKFNPKIALAYNNRGLAYRRLKQNERAIEDCNKAIELNPEYAPAYNNRGVAYRKLKQYEKEQEDYKKALELKPNHISAMLDLSESYIITKNYVGAHEIAEGALNIAEENKDIIISHFLMFCSPLFQNKNEDAKSQLNRLIDYLEKIKDWTLTWDFSDIKQAIGSSDIDENAKSLMLSLTELLENKIALDEFKSIFSSSIMFS